MTRPAQGPRTLLAGIAFALLVVAGLAFVVSGARVEAQPATPSGSPAGGPTAAGEPTADGAPDGADGEFASADDGTSGPPAWLDRWLYNPAERSRRGAAAFDDEDAATAAGRYDDALRLAPDAPTARYNAGTAGLAVGDPTAAELLDGLVEEGSPGEAPPALAARAAYNRGTAALQAQDAASAVDALTRSLRLDPDFDDAKHNLELALRLLEQQQQDQQGGQDQPQDGEQGDQEQEQQNQQGDQEQDQQEQQEGEQDSQEQQSEQDQQEQQDEDSQDGEQEQEGQQPQPEGDESQQPPQDPGGAGQGAEESPLPQFQDLPDMSAEEAAAILEAIENLEREQRREEALEAARRTGRAEKDW